MSKKAKKKKEPSLEQMPVLPNDYAEHTSALAGMTSEEIIKLLEALERIDDSVLVSRRRPVKGKNSSKEVGGRHRKMTLDEAIEYEKKRAEERTEKERKVQELHRLDSEAFERDEINDEIYPKRLTPTDIVRSLDAAKERLEEEDRAKEKRGKVFSPKEEVLLNVLTEVKKLEAVRVARRIAEKQRQTVLGKTLEELGEERERRVRETLGLPEPIEETPEEREERLQQEEEAKQEMIRTLPGFDKHAKNLVEEVGEVTGENVEAAAAVVRQWIGNIVNSD